MQAGDTRPRVRTPKKETLMAKNKNRKAEKPEFGGCVTFDGCKM
jgi:hypothetical protein